VSLRRSLLSSLYGCELDHWSYRLSRPNLRALSLRPDDLLTILKDGFVDRLRKFGFSPPRYPSYEASDFCLGGSISHCTHLLFLVAHPYRGFSPVRLEGRSIRRCVSPSSTKKFRIARLESRPSCTSLPVASYPRSESGDAVR